MQAHDPRHIVAEYLLNTLSMRDSSVIEPDSIRILRERSVLDFILYLVTYKDQEEQQLYAIIRVERNEAGDWRFGGFHLVGGRDPRTVQELPRQVVSGASLDFRLFYAGGYVIHNGIQVTKVRLIDAGGHIFEDQVQDDGVFFVVSEQRVEKPIQVELYDASNVLVARHPLFDPELEEMLKRFNKTTG